MIKVLLVVFLAVTLAQFAPSCQGTGREVIGWVDAKYYLAKRQSYVIVINNVEYDVPDDFYDQVQIGDLVKRDPQTGMWTILKKRGT